MENIAPQLTALEKAHADTRSKLQKEQQLRRNAEMLQEDSEAKCREMEGTLAALRDECDAVHEELAFKDSELEETRLELEVERARHREEVEELKCDLSVQRSMAEEARALPDEPSLEEVPSDSDYVKRLEDELEIVTEQLIDTEQKLTKTQEMLAEEQARSQSLAVPSTEEKESVDESVLLELKEENSILKAYQQKLKEEMELAQEELQLTQEELKAAEEDAKQFQAKMDEARISHRDELNSLKKELEKAVTDAKTHEAELKTLEQTLQATSAETVSLKQENENLQLALENAKNDAAALVQELEDVNARFDEVRQEAERSGRDKAATEIREEMAVAHEQEIAELHKQFKELSDANADLQKTVDIVETALAAERDRQKLNVANGVPSEVEEKLKSQLERTKDELRAKTREVENLKSSFEGRIAKAEEDVARLEKELSTTKGKLAEAEANLIVIRREKERAAATIPKSKSPVATSRKAPMEDEESRDDVGRLTPDSQSSRRATAMGGKRRSRSLSPTTPDRLKYRVNEEEKKYETLQEEYDQLKAQHKMAEAHNKRLEDDLKAIQMQLFANNGDTAVATQMSRISTLVSPRKGGDDLSDVREGTDAVEEVIRSGDVELVSEELRKLEKKSAMQREHNAQLLSKILSLQGNIQVCCRVRPLRMAEIQQGSKSAVEAFSETEVGCFDARANKWKSFGFDKVWGPDQSQHDVFQDVEPLALSVVDGYNACIFAYGQT